MNASRTAPRTVSRAVALALATMVTTLAMAGVDRLATQEHAAPQLANAAAARAAA